MPTRLLRDWTASPRINELSEGAEVFFIRLIMKADDFGRYYAVPRLLMGILYPLKTAVSVDHIERYLNECLAAGIISIYQAEGKNYLQILDFGQRLRQAREKFPQPSGDPPSTRGQVADKLRATGGQVADNPPTTRGQPAVNPPQVDGLKRREEKRRDSDFEEEEENEGVKRSENENFTHTDFVFPQKKMDELIPIETLMIQALHDPRWLKASGADEFELKIFNSIMEKRFRYEMTPADYRAYFASMKDKFPERFRKPKTSRDYFDEARRLDDDQNNQ